MCLDKNQRQWYRTYAQVDAAPDKVSLTTYVLVSSRDNEKTTNNSKANANREAYCATNWHLLVQATCYACVQMNVFSCCSYDVALQVSARHPFIYKTSFTWNISSRASSLGSFGDVFEPLGKNLFRRLAHTLRQQDYLSAFLLVHFVDKTLFQRLARTINSSREPTHPRPLDEALRLIRHHLLLLSKAHIPSLRKLHPLWRHRKFSVSCACMQYIHIACHKEHHNMLQGQQQSRRLKSPPLHLRCAASSLFLVVTIVAAIHELDLAEASHELACLLDANETHENSRKVVSS